MFKPGAADTLSMEIGVLERELEALAPPGLAEEMDAGRIGLVVEGRPDIRGVACALDVTPAVIDRAIALGSDLLVVHHTPIWTPVTSIRGGLAPMLRDILSAGLNIYVMHTNFDHAPGGVNNTLSVLLELKDVERMSLGVCGTCRLGIGDIQRLLSAPVLLWGEPELPCRIGVVGGSGFDDDLIAEAAGLGAEAFLSSDLKHNVARSSPIPLIETTHYALEAPAMRELAARKGWSFIDDPPVVRAWS